MKWRHSYLPLEGVEYFVSDNGYWKKYQNAETGERTVYPCSDKTFVTLGVGKTDKEAFAKFIEECKVLSAILAEQIQKAEEILNDCEPTTEDTLTSVEMEKCSNFRDVCAFYQVAEHCNKANDTVCGYADENEKTKSMERNKKMKFERSKKVSTNDVYYEHGDWVLVNRDEEAFLFYNKKYKIREGWGITIDKAVEDYIRNLTMYIEKFNKLKSEAVKIAGNMEIE